MVGVGLLQVDVRCRHLVIEAFQDCQRRFDFGLVEAAVDREDGLGVCHCLYVGFLVSGNEGLGKFLNEFLRALIFGLIPVPGLIFAGIILLFWVILKYTKFGRYIYAIGGNEEAARLAGVPVWRVKISVYAISGYLAALAGILYVAQYRQGKPDAGMGLELDAIAAVVIGGTSLMGGRGSMIGTLVGVLIFGFLSNILQLNNIDSNTQLVLKGIIIIVAVLLQERRSSGWLFFLSQLMTATPSKKSVPGKPENRQGQGD